MAQTNLTDSPLSEDLRGRVFLRYLDFSYFLLETSSASAPCASVTPKITKRVQPVYPIQLRSWGHRKKHRFLRKKTQICQTFGQKGAVALRGPGPRVSPKKPAKSFDCRPNSLRPFRSNILSYFLNKIYFWWESFRRSRGPALSPKHANPITSDQKKSPLK